VASASVPVGAHKLHTYIQLLQCCLTHAATCATTPGAEVLVHDAETGQLLRNFQNLHAGEACAVEGSRNGRWLFTGGQDGLIIAHDLRMKVGASWALGAAAAIV
jgi:hypothetical protein